MLAYFNNTPLKRDSELSASYHTAKPTGSFFVANNQSFTEGDLRVV